MEKPITLEKAIELLPRNEFEKLKRHFTEETEKKLTERAFYYMLKREITISSLIVLYDKFGMIFEPKQRYFYIEQRKTLLIND